MDCLISRHHCRLDIDPPCVVVRDLESLNGTYLNGHRLESTALTAALQHVSGSGVQDGDILTIGGSSLRVDIVDCPPSNSTEDVPPCKEGEAVIRDCPIPC